MKIQKAKIQLVPFLALFVLLAATLLIAGCSSAEPTAVPTAVPDAGAPPPDTVGPVAILPEPGEGEPTLEVKVNVNMRSGPGTNYPVLALLSGGQKAILVGISPDSTYYAVSVPVAAAEQGWVDANYALVSNVGDLPVIQPPPPPPTVEFQPPQPGDPAATALVETHVRTGPGADYPAYGFADMGAKALLIGYSEDGQWLVVRLNPEYVGKGHGWVQIDFASVENADNLPTIETPPHVEVVPPPPPAAGAPTATATDFINVRTGPGLNYPVLSVAPPGATGEVSGKSADGQWWQVKISESYGTNGLAWVSAGYVNTSNTDGVPVVDAPAPPDIPGNPPGLLPCFLVSQTPADGTLVQSGAGFNMLWQVENTGTVAWDQADSTVVYLAAANDTRLSSVDSFALTTTVGQGDSYEVVVPMTAPAETGQYGEGWGIISGDTTVCQFWNIIQVSN
ncbi:MAG: SH3 domain-containing protein [Chloroflexota bacterium]|nr:SH3 domain-containing protein [Chloroflexota bacterium]